MKSPKNIGPDFICIGPQKTGTTWLYSCLQMHKSYYDPGIKGPSYFLYKQSKQNGIIPHLRYRKNNIKRYFDKKMNLHYSKYKNASNDEQRRLVSVKIEHRIRIAFGFFSQNYYFSLFKDKGDKVTGDISENYFKLNDRSKEQIAALMPNTKIIIFLREPCELIWSFLKMQNNSKDGFNNLESLNPYIKRYFNNFKNYPMPDLKTWNSLFKEKNVFIGYFEELQENPILYFQKVCRFLEISDKIEECIDTTKIQSKIDNPSLLLSPGDFISYRYNKTQSLEMPAELKKLCYNYFYQNVEELSKYIDSPYPKKWLQKYDLYFKELKNG